MRESTVLYKPVSPAQLAQIIRHDWARLMADNKEQQYLYLKCHQNYADSIAKQWNAPQYSAGFVLAVPILNRFLKEYPVHSIAYEEHQEYCIPVQRLGELNQHLACKLSLVSAFSSHKNREEDIERSDCFYQFM